MKTLFVIPVMLWLCMIIGVDSVEAQLAGHVVISEVYGGGGNSGAVYKNDFIELYNPTGVSVPLTGWSLQYASATGSFSAKTVLSGSISAYGFFLVQEAQGSGGTAALPAPDVIGVIGMSASSGKVALANDTIAVTGPSSANVVDFAGYGATANAFEGSGPAPAPGNTTSIERKSQASSTAATLASGGADETGGNGWDSGNNSTDFVAQGSIAPQNTSSPSENPPSGNHIPNIVSVGRTIFVPAAGTSDSVHAVITGTVAGAKLHVRINGGTYDSSLTMSVVSASTYAARISAAKNASNGNLIEYFVSATDDSGNYTSSANTLEGYFVGDVPVSAIKAHSPAAIAGYGARVNGSINVKTNVLQNGGTFLQDGTSGIHLFAPGMPSLDAGRNARVQGDLTSSSGSYEISGTDFRIIDSSGTSTLTPVIVSLPVALQSPSNLNEGRLVKFLAVATDSTGTFAASKNYLYHTGSGDTISVSVQSNGGANTLAGASIPVSPVDAVGILQYVNGYLGLRPRRAEDMGAAPPATYEAAASGNWSDTLTWSGHKIPVASDDVTMTTLGVTVTIDVANAQCHDLTLTGSGNASNSGPVLQFKSTGAPQLTVNGNFSQSGGTGGGSGNRGGRSQLTSNGNGNATLVFMHNLSPRSSNTTGNGNAGLTMNQGTVKLLGSTTDSLKNGAGFRLANLIIGDGTHAKSIVWAPTVKSTLSVTSLTVKTGSTFWIGSDADTNGNNIGNAFASGVPTLTGGIRIDSGAAMKVQDFASGVDVASINLDGGGITNNGTLDLRIGASIAPEANEGSMPAKTLSGCHYNISFGGLPAGSSGSKQLIAGNHAARFADVTVGAADTLVLQQDMDLSSLYKLTLNGVLLESPAHTVQGHVGAIRTLSVDSPENFGGIGVTVDAAGASPETTRVARVTGVAQTGSGHTSILRYYDISPNVNTGLNATLQFSYDESELEGQNESSLQLWESTDGGSTWISVPCTVDAANNRITAAGINSFSRWTAADASHALGSSFHDFVVNADWNMVSLPLAVADYRKTMLFPDAISNAFAYSNAYITKDTLENGAGYWMKFPALDTVSILGTGIGNDTIDVIDGWNLIGSIGSPVPAGSIVQIPGSIVMSPYFGYSGSYVVNDSLEPSRAYWVKVAGNGKLVLNGSASPAPQGHPEREVPENFNSLMISDNEGHQQVLQFGKNNGKLSIGKFELPPLPPAGSFDVRFSSQHSVAAYPAYPGDACEFPISVQAGAYPLLLKWHIVSTENSFLLSGREMNGDGSMRIGQQEARALSLRVVDHRSLPSAFGLGQNYPNPFNPSTRFTIALPKDSDVKVMVYDVFGKLVTTLVEGIRTAGYHTLEWNGRSGDGAPVSSGLYVIRMITGGFTAIQKILMMK